MPRVTPCRLLKTFLLGWLFMIFLWWALPSPTISPHEREAHIQKTLASGHPLITVNDWTTEFNLQNRGDMSSGQAFIIRWQLKQALRAQEVLLELGPGRDVNLAEVINKANWFNSAQPGRNSSEWKPYFDDARAFDGIWTGDVEFSEICLPWFHNADKHFITHEMHGFTGTMVLRFVVPQPGVLELWLEAAVTSYMDASDYLQLHTSGLIPHEEHRQEMYRHAWEYIEEPRRESGILATFRNLEMKKVQDVVVKDMKGDLLSTTYPIRGALLVPLAPVWSIGFFVLSIIFDVLSSTVPVLMFIAFQGGLSCAGIMLSCWLRDGRPEFSEWSRHFWMTRWIPRREGRDAKEVWGPSGPVLTKSVKKGKWDEESAMLQRPQTVRLGRHWKR